MASQQKRFATGQLAGAAASIYAPGVTRAQFIAATLTNTDASALTFSLWIVPSGDSNADANVVYDTATIDAGKTIQLGAIIGHILNPGDALWGVASSATKLTYHLSGSVITTS